MSSRTRLPEDCENRYLGTKGVCTHAFTGQKVCAQVEQESVRRFTSQTGSGFSFPGIPQALESCLLAPGDRQPVTSASGVMSKEMLSAIGHGKTQLEEASCQGQRQKFHSRMRAAEVAIRLWSAGACFPFPSPDLEDWMVHTFGWMPSGDILKFCCRSFY